MGIENFKKFGQLAKLTITPFDESGASSSIPNEKSIEVMFNPESYTRKYSISYEKENTVDTKEEKYVYKKSEPQDFTLKIYIDGTDVSEFNAPLLPVFKKNEQSVSEKVEEFINMTYRQNGKNQVPFVSIDWGPLKIEKCRLRDVTINYSLFNRQGEPLRAELDATFVIGDEKKGSSGKTKDVESVEENKPPEKTVQNGIVINVT